MNAENEESLQQQMEEVFAQLPKQLRVMEEGIDAPTMAAFQTMQQVWKDEHPEHTPEQASQATLPALADLLEWDKADDQETFRKALVHLAQLGTVAAFRYLEQLAATSQVSQINKTWLNLALLHCRMRLENALSDEPIGFIATGLGGKGDKIRYYFAVRSLTGVFLEGQARWAEQSFRSAATQADAEIEWTEAGEGYLGFSMLLSWKVPVVGVIGQGIEQCEDFLDSTFWITNVAKPSTDELGRWVRGGGA